MKHQIVASLAALLIAGCADGAIDRIDDDSGVSDPAADARDLPETAPIDGTDSAPPSASDASASDAAKELTDDAAIVSAEVPATLACDAVASARITVKNTGTSTWTAGGGYKLGAVGDDDPLTGSVTRVELPVSTSVPPGGTHAFEIPLRAPATAGSYVTDWQMVRESVAWFGAVRASSVSVACTKPVDVDAPYRMDVVNAVAEKYGHLLTTNTYESCGEFVQRVLMALGDAEWGHVAKTSGEAQYTPTGFAPRTIDGHTITGFSHDVIYHRATNRQVDIIGNASANSDPRPEIWGPARVQWDQIPPEHYRANNPWMATIPVP